MSKNSAKFLDSNKSKKIPQQIAKVILRVYSKTNFELANNTTTKLSFDLFNSTLRSNLLKQTLLELEKTLVNMLSSEIELQVLMKKREMILTNILYNVFDKMSLELNVKKSNDILTNGSIITYTIQECCVCLELFLNGLYFENDLISNTNKVTSLDTVTDDMLEALIDTIVVRISHCIGYILIDFHPQESIYEHYSIRHINSFRNILSREFYVERYVFKPKALYENKQLLWIISPQGIFCRYIYTKRDSELRLPTGITNLILEIVDFISPIIFNVINSIRKTITFIFSKIILEVVYILRKAVKSFVNISN